MAGIAVGVAAGFVASVLSRPKSNGEGTMEADEAEKWKNRVETLQSELKALKTEYEGAMGDGKGTQDEYKRKMEDLNSANRNLEKKLAELQLARENDAKSFKTLVSGWKKDLERAAYKESSRREGGTGDSSSTFAEELMRLIIEQMEIELSQRGGGQDESCTENDLKMMTKRLEAGKNLIRIMSNAESQQSVSMDQISKLLGIEDKGTNLEAFTEKQRPVRLLPGGTAVETVAQQKAKMLLSSHSIDKENANVSAFGLTSSMRRQKVLGHGKAQPETEVVREPLSPPRAITISTEQPTAREKKKRFNISYGRRWKKNEGPSSNFRDAIEGRNEMGESSFETTSALTIR